MTAEQTITPAVYTVLEAAAYLQLGPTTIYKLLKEGRIPHSRLGKSIRFRREDLDKYIEENTAKTYRRIEGLGRPAGKKGARA